jgi:hypothetical protein
MFANGILSDGVSVNFLFGRGKPDPELVEPVELEFTDFSEAELAQQFNLIGLDPGRTQAFTAAYGYGSTPHELRRCSTKEYYAIACTKSRNLQTQRLKKEAGIHIIESQIPTAKTASLRRYDDHVSYLLLHYDELAAFYSSSHGITRFNNYRGKQKAGEAMVHMLTNGGSKYNRNKRTHKSRNRRRRKRNKEGRQRKKEEDALFQTRPVNVETMAPPTAP